MVGIGSIQKALLHRIAAVTLVLAQIAAIGLYFFELEMIDEQVVAHARSEAQVGRDLVQQLKAGKPVSRQEVDQLFRHFDIVELYDAQRHKLATFSRFDEEEAGLEETEEKLPPHPFPKDGQPHYRRLELDDERIWQVLLPLTDEQGRLIGFFEGIYKPTALEMEQLEEGVLAQVGILFGAILLTSLVLYPIYRRVMTLLARQRNEVIEGNIQLLEVMGEAVAKRDSDTDIHNYRVTAYALRLGTALGLDSKALKNIAVGSFLHDVGKIAIPDHILLKPGRLTEDEFAVMKTHVSHGAQILSRAKWLAEARDIPLYHHEKWDGSGYMEGLKGEQIPLMARIFALVDVFDALTSERPYKEPMPLDKALAIIEEGAGSHFDPNLTALFIAHARDWYEVIYCVDEEVLRTRVADKVRRLMRATDNEQLFPGG